MPNDTLSTARPTRKRPAAEAPPPDPAKLAAAADLADLAGLRLTPDELHELTEALELEIASGPGLRGVWRRASWETRALAIAGTVALSLLAVNSAITDVQILAHYLR